MYHRIKLILCAMFLAGYALGDTGGISGVSLVEHQSIGMSSGSTIYWGVTENEKLAYLVLGLNPKQKKSLVYYSAGEGFFGKRGEAKKLGVGDHPDFHVFGAIQIEGMIELDYVELKKWMKEVDASKQRQKNLFLDLVKWLSEGGSHYRLQIEGLR